MKPQDFIIVIGRQYGSGGRRLGRLLAEKLSIPYYDKELLSEAATSLGFRSDIFEKADERRNSKLFSLIGAACGASTYFTAGALHDDTVYQFQSDVIRALLEKGSCVIVGRTADYIARDLPNTVSLFLCADREVRVARAIERNAVPVRHDPSAWLDRQDAVRADYYNYYTGRKWGRAENYDLCINTSNLQVEQATELVLSYLNNLCRNREGRTK
ncbi:MAG: cytidylate kinase-like family protein [Prevotella sp.]|nr:cytidylate kinase-like family protein [Prevotella sp.]MCM1074310.1 cytidylate kinase-like family protein [Ruminococcus sp.]